MKPKSCHIFCKPSFCSGLGNGTTNFVADPFPAKILVDKFGGSFTNIIMVSARDYHNIAFKADGSVWMWGGE